MWDIIEGKNWYINKVALPILRGDWERCNSKVKIQVSVNGNILEADIATIDDEEAEMKIHVHLAGHSDLENTTPYSFRLLDGDGLVYAYGWSEDDSSFAPLDDFGEPSWGCVSIEYFNEEKLEWEEL